MAIKLQSLLSTWKNFDFNSTQQELDETANTITSKQDESDISRKKLVEQLKECKKNLPETMKELAPLIRSFQNEVDFLNQRSKLAETAFLKNYQKFLDVIDPVTGLEYAVSLEKKVCLHEEFELENRRMKQTIQEYNDELKEVKNQDVTIKNLKEKVRNYEDQMENTVTSKMKELEKEYNSIYVEKESLLSENHKHATQKLSEVEERNQSLQRALELSQSELFEIKSKLDDLNEAKSGEIEILINDLERAYQQLSTTQKELTELKQQINNSDSSHKSEYNTNIKSIEVSSLEAEILNKDKEISQVISDVKRIEAMLQRTKEHSSEHIQKLQDELHDSKSLISNFEKRIAQMKDYDELKRELAIIKSIEFDCVSDFNKKNSPNSTTSKPLELLLLEKNKALQNENTNFKLQTEELSKMQTELQKEFTDMKYLNEEQKILITQLESDLSCVQSNSLRDPRVQNVIDGSSQADLLSHAVKSVESPQGQSKSTSPTGENMLNIVSAQRERFKLRNEELEAELDVKNTQLHTVQSELASLRTDNLKLYEKVRFLQSYEGRSSARQQSSSEARYSNQYENSLDPFLTFSQREKQKRYSSLSPFEKVTFNFGQFILTSKSARTATLIYLSVLHCLVFIVLYKFAFNEAWRRDYYSDCKQKFAEHMHDVHRQ